MAEKYTCIVCRRKFPRGQGVVIELGKTALTFHSARCATKFFKLLVERVEDIKSLEDAAKRVIRELEEQHQKLEELRRKRI